MGSDEPSLKASNTLRDEPSVKAKTLSLAAPILYISPFFCLLFPQPVRSNQPPMKAHHREREMANLLLLDKYGHLTYIQRYEKLRAREGK